MRTDVEKMIIATGSADIGELVIWQLESDSGIVGCWFLAEWWAKVSWIQLLIIVLLVSVLYNTSNVGIFARIHNARVAGMKTIRQAMINALNADNEVCQSIVVIFHS